MLNCISTSYPHLKTELDQGVLTIMIDRASCKNALNLQMYDDLRTIVEEADQSDQVRVLILRGIDADFSAGNDMKSFLQLPQLPEAGQAGSTPPFMLLKAMAQFSKPCIAAVRGVCIGVANTLLLHFDFIYADRTAVFQMPFVSLGLSLEGAASILLAQRSSYLHATDILFKAQKYDAEKALQAGILSEIVNDPYQKAMSEAQYLASLPMASLKAVKKLMKHDIERVLKCIDEEAEVVMQRANSPEMFEAVSAFMQKRPPDFSQFH